MAFRSNIVAAPRPARVADELIARACSDWGVPRGYAEKAARVTLARIPWDSLDERRSERRHRAYFWAVLRRKVLRSQGAALGPLRARFALASVAQDLRAAGLGEGEVRVRLASECPDILAEAGVTLGQMELVG